MIIKLGPLAAEVAGSVGGLTMQRSPFGTVARSKPLPTLRRSAYSGDSRQRLATLSRMWRTMSPADRADWETFAGTVSWYNRFGDPVQGSGYRAFLRCNLASHTSPSDVAQQPIQLKYPTAIASTLPLAPEFQFDTSTNSLLLYSTDIATDAQTALFLFASPPLPAGRSVYHRAAPFLTYLPAATPLPQDLTGTYQRLHGRLPDHTRNEAAFLRVQARNAGHMWPGAETVLPLTYV